MIPTLSGIPGYRSWAFDSGAVSDAVDGEVELDPSSRCCSDSACEPFGAHSAASSSERCD